jgi:DNA polymerase-3 subunit beta
MGAPAFTCNTSDLVKGLRDIKDIIRGPQTIPIIGNVLIEAEAGGSVRLTSTNLDMIATRTIAAVVDEPGTTTVPAGRFTEVVNSFAQGSQCRVGIEDKGGKLAVAAGRARFTFGTLPSGDFPRLAFGDEAVTFSMPRATLEQALSIVRHSIANEEKRYYLNGAYLHVKDKTLRFAATDGHRLARVVLPVPTGGEKLPGSIMSTGTVDLIRKLAADGDGDVKIDVAKDRFRFDFGDVVVIAKAVDGTYPDYVRPIPTDVANRALLDRDSFAEAVRRTSLASDDKVRGLRLTFTTHKLTLSVVGLIAQGAEEVPCEYTGPDFVVGFNGRYLMDALGALNVDTVEIGMNGPRDPTLFTSPASENLTLLVVPMNA